jgi:phosphoribosylanthranilate isomerase
MKLHWKICGMKYKDNIKEILSLKPDYMGFIFYQKSPRYMNDLSFLSDLSFGTTKKVGVFVNESVSQIIEYRNRYQLDLVQLHGDEKVEDVQKLQEEGVKTIKVFRVTNKLPFAELDSFEGLTDYFLFDTKTDKYGGSGKTFDWGILDTYTYKTPYFLSGGLDIESIEEIKIESFPGLHAVDLNSKFEVEPGLKDFEKIKILNNDR